MRAVASLTRNSGEYAEARALGEQALALYRELGDDSGQTSTLVGLCITSLALQDFEAGLEQGREAIARAERLGNQRILGTAFNATGGALRCLGRTAQAEELFNRSRDVWVEIDDRRGLAGTLNNLALVAHQNQDHGRSRELCLQALRLYRELDLTEGMIDILEMLASLEDNPAAALRILTIAGTQRVRIGAPQIIPDELAARDHAETEARRALGPEADAVAAAAQYEPIEPVVDALLTSR